MQSSFWATVILEATFLLAKPINSLSWGVGEYITTHAIEIQPRVEIPDPPEPEPIEITELPMPPVVSVNDSCFPNYNPKATGCIGQTPGLTGVSFMPDGRHVVAPMIFIGAPDAPDPASIYSGEQLVLIKADGTTFSNGDPWKCITCGLPEENSVGRGLGLDYPQAFRDGKRILAGTNVIDCGEFGIADDDCTPETTYIYPIRWNDQSDGQGVGGAMRELRLNPDNIHLAWNHIFYNAAGIGQYSYLGRLEFNPQPISGVPLAPRYDLINVNLLRDSSGSSIITIMGDSLYINRSAIAIGETRGFSGDGLEVTYVGYNFESCNNDVFAVHLETGVVRRLTAHPEYADPVDISPDNQWHVVEDTRETGRQMFLAGMRGIPPIIDLLVSGAVSSTRNNGERRFFQPWLLDRYGDRAPYFGQELNNASYGIPGSGAIDDPEWNARADPKWSLDGTRIVYFQRQTVSPECGNPNPLPCYPSTAQGGRIDRIMVANLTNRKPLPIREVDPIPDFVPWAYAYTTDMEIQADLVPKPGLYHLKGNKSGNARIHFIGDANSTTIQTITVEYANYSDDGLSKLNGYENVTLKSSTGSAVVLDWNSDIVQTGQVSGTKQTSPDGFILSIDILTDVFEANGSLTTTINGEIYLQPANGT